MTFIRLCLIVLMTLTASVSGAVDAGHMTAMEHTQASPPDGAVDRPGCCMDGSERAQTCHFMPALVPVSDFRLPKSDSCADISFGSGLLLTGIEPSGPLDPPRAV